MSISFRKSKKSVQLKVYIDEEVDKKLREYIINTFNTYKRGLLSVVVQNAIMEYISKGNTSTHAKQRTLPLGTDGGVTIMRQHDEISPDDYMRLRYLATELKRYRSKFGSRIRGSSLDKIIKNKRWSIPKYRRLLLDYGFIEVDYDSSDMYFITV